MAEKFKFKKGDCVDVTQERRIRGPYARGKVVDTNTRGKVLDHVLVGKQKRYLIQLKGSSHEIARSERVLRKCPRKR